MKNTNKIQSGGSMKTKILYAAGMILFTGLLTSNGLFAQSVSKSNTEKMEKAKQDTVQTTEVTQTVCPVMGGEINKEVYADYNGKRVYFCCQDCLSTFKKDPEKYMKKLEDEGVTLENAPEQKKP
jgi:YHS domain-containing protein